MIQDEPQNFRALIQFVRRKMPQGDEMGLRSSAIVIEVEVRVAVLLRIMAGSTYVDMMIIFGPARSTVYKMFSETTEIIIDALPLAGFPEGEALLLELSIAVHDILHLFQSSDGMCRRAGWDCCPYHQAARVR